MEKSLRVLMASDADAILAMERQKIQAEISDELEASMAEWHAKWRKESLEFYLPKGWSFGIFHGEKIQAYFLAQPLVFFRGFTQSLWLEYIQFQDHDEALELIEVAYKTAKEKHLQKFLVADTKIFTLISKKYKNQNYDEYVDINTTKMD